MNKLVIYIFLVIGILSYSQTGILDVPEDENQTIEIKKFPKNFKENYTDEVFQYEYDFDPNQLSVWQQFEHWLSQKFNDWFNIVDEKKAARFTKYLFRTLYVLAFLAVLYFILKTIINKEGNWVFGRKSDSVNIHATILKEDLLETNFDDLIYKAKENNDYRLAIRYYYLKVLKNLTEKQIIDWDNEKTNHDYIYEIKEDSLREQFEYISYVYDYCWYGEFQLNENSFEEAENKFNQLIQQIHG